MKLWSCTNQISFMFLPNSVKLVDIIAETWSFGIKLDTVEDISDVVRMFMFLDIS